MFFFKFRETSRTEYLTLKKILLAANSLLKRDEGNARETAPVLTSDNRSKSILVLTHSFVPPLRANLGFGLSIHPPEVL